MNKKDIVFRIKNSVLIGEEFWVIMGAALVLYGIKDQTNDIDIGCSIKSFDKLIKEGYPLKTSRSGKRKIQLEEKISVYEDWKTDEIISIEGIPVADISSIIRDKKNLAREKDLQDIRLINDFLEG